MFFNSRIKKNTGGVIMKTKIAILTAILTFAVINIFAQGGSESNGKGSKMNMPPATFKTTQMGLNVSVWVMTAAEHKKMMEGMKGQMQGSSTKDASAGKMDMKMSGSHHIKVEIMDEKTGQPRNDLGVKVETSSPAKMSSTVDLMNKSNHYGSDISLDEKGTYSFVLNIDDKGVPNVVKFKYVVK
jgi:hypothetical protein